MAWIKKRLNVNTVFLAAILGVLAFIVVSSLRPPVSYKDLPYTPEPAVICAGDALSWVSRIEMSANAQPADMTTARDLWDETHNRWAPGIYRTRPFIIPHSVAYTETQVFSSTARLVPAEYSISDTTGGRLTARSGYAVRFTVKAC